MNNLILFLENMGITYKDAVYQVEYIENGGTLEIMYADEHIIENIKNLDIPYRVTVLSDRNIVQIKKIKKIRKLKELWYWLKAQITLDNSYFTDLEDLQHENNELRATIELLQDENKKLHENIQQYQSTFDETVLDDFNEALFNFLSQMCQSDTSDMLTNELCKNGEVEVQIAGKDVNRKRIKQAFGNFERYMTIDIVERGLYYSLIFKKRKDR